MSEKTTRRIKLPKGTDFVTSQRIYKRFIRKRKLPEYFLIKNYLAEHLFHSRADNPRDMSIVIAFVLGISVSDICDVFGITYEEFVSLHLPRCLRAKLAIFTELFQALFVSAVVDRNWDAIKSLLDITIGSIADLRAMNLQSLLGFLGEGIFGDEELEKSKLYRAFNEKIAERRTLLYEMLLDYQRTIADILSSQGISENVDEIVDQMIAEVEERFLIKDEPSKT